MHPPSLRFSVLGSATGARDLGHGLGFDQGDALHTLPTAHRNFDRVRSGEFVARCIHLCKSRSPGVDQPAHGVGAQLPP